ncbi:hypothetical protein B296_00046612 [Ensete ventricosum]|uniref:Uncharacterized protein n=1 Tax=Ensete ventricosum TaxID=4639 RepID=A0A426XP03_ENSVE|nr:hypothetical protein B296_00046612 [Ensete ventricosum]
MAASILKKVIFSNKKLVLLPINPKSEDMKFLVDMAKEGKLKTILDSVHPLSKAKEASAKSMSSHAPGRLLSKCSFSMMASLSESAIRPLNKNRARGCAILGNASTSRSLSRFLRSPTHREHMAEEKSTMKAIQYASYGGGAGALKVSTPPIRIYLTTSSFCETVADVAGEVAELGPEVSAYKKGDKVVGMLNFPVSV